MPQLSVPVRSADHTVGPENAPVTLVEYGDFQCPSCLVASRVVEKLLRQFNGRLRFVFRHFPLEMHPMAEPAAEFAEFAATQGKFWPAHHALFAHQEQLAPETLLELAARLELDPAAVTQALDEEQFYDRINEDVESGTESGVHGTPTFFLNGHKYSGPGDYDSLAAAIEEASRG